MYENLIETREAADLTRDRIVQLAVNAFEASSTGASSAAINLDAWNRWP